MRSARALRALTAGFALLAATPAYAEWHIVPLVGLTFRATTNAPLVGPPPPIGVHPDFGGAVALLGEGILGVEGIGVFTPSFKADADVVNGTVQSSRALAVMGNVVLTTPRRWTEYSLRPYLSGGLGVMRLSVVDAGGGLGTQLTAPGFDIGGGAVFQHITFDARFERLFEKSFFAVHRHEDDFDG